MSSKAAQEQPSCAALLLTAKLVDYHQLAERVAETTPYKWSPISNSCGRRFRVSYFLLNLGYVCLF